MFDRTDQEDQLAVIKNSQLLVHEGAGHGVHWEEMQCTAEKTEVSVQERMCISFEVFPV